MKCFTKFSLVTTVLLGLATLGNAGSKSRQKELEKAIQCVPKSAYGFGFVADFQRVFPKLQSLTNNNNPYLMALKRKVKEFKGFDKKGPIFIVLLEGKIDTNKKKNRQGIPKFVVMIPVTNQKDFLKNFNKVEKDGRIFRVSNNGFDAVLTHHRDYILMTEPKNRSCLQMVVNCKESIGNSMHVDTGWLAKQDVAVYFTHNGVETYLDLLRKIFVMQANLREAGISDSQDAGEKKRERDLKVVNKIFSKVFSMARKNVAAIGHGLRIDKNNNIIYVEKTYLKKNSPLAKGLKDAVVPKDLYSGVPQRKYAFVTAISLPKEVESTVFDFIHLVLKASSSAITEDKIRSQLHQVMEGSRELAGLKVSRFVLLAHPAKGEAKVGICGLMEVEDANKVMKQTAAWLKKFGNISRRIDDEDSQLVGVTKKKIQVHGKPAMQLTTTYKREGDSKKKGKDFWKAYSILSVVNKNTVAFGVSDHLDNAKHLAEAYHRKKMNFSEGKHVRKALSMLPKNSHMVCLLNLKEVFSWTREKETKRFPASAQIGFAVQFSPEEINETLIIPSSTLRGLMHSQKNPLNKTFSK